MKKYPRVKNQPVISVCIYRSLDSHKTYLTISGIHPTYYHAYGSFLERLPIPSKLRDINKLYWILLGQGCCSVAQSYPTLCDSMDCSTSGFPVLHCPPKFAQTHVYWADDVMQPSHPLLPASPPVLNLYQQKGFSQRVSSSH